MDKKCFLDKLTELMDSKKVTRKMLSDETGISRSTIDNWYARGDNNPNRQALVSIAKFFGVSLYYLCDDNCTVDPTPSKNNPFAKYLSDGEVLAFHLDDNCNVSDLTKEEIEEVINFIQFVKSKRSNDESK